MRGKEKQKTGANMEERKYRRRKEGKRQGMNKGEGRECERKKDGNQKERGRESERKKEGNEEESSVGMRKEEGMDQG